MDLLAQGAAWLAGQRAASMASWVTYTRPGAPDLSVDLAATPDATTFEIDDGYGAVERIVARDYLITATDLVLSGMVVLPQPGDQIAEMTPGGLLVYEAMYVGKEPCWCWSDPYRNTIRVHTKQVTDMTAYRKGTVQ